MRIVTVRKGEQPSVDPYDDGGAFAWLMEHEDELDVHAGKWVIIGPAGLAAVAEDPDVGFEDAKRQGIRLPLLHYVKSPVLRKMPHVL
jgi:hypothetical protein